MANNIRAIREQRDMTMRELADRLGIEWAAIYKWEHQKNDPRMGMAIKLANVLDCTLDQLMGLTPFDPGPA